uniref:G-protein coupled receptors family 1 profile domain-containing protein n=1 Tax=Pseudonaja textilis TaxID=8673 RepID=A0A670ZLL5_PSETE
MSNHTVILEFILLGIPNTEGLQNILFVVFLFFCLLTLTGNLLILIAFLANLWAGSRTVSLGGCTCQVFFYHFLGSTKCLLYTIMAYDHYTAICHPLRYSIIMNRKVCALLAAGTWFTSSFHAIFLTSLTFTLPYCRSNEVDYFLFDIFPVVKLVCADTYIIETVSFINIGVVPMACFFLMLTSYVRILISILKMQSVEMVCFFFGPCALLYIQPSLSDILATPIQIFCNVVTPMLNPLIYTLQNKEVQSAFRRLKACLSELIVP